MYLFSLLNNASLGISEKKRKYVRLKIISSDQDDLCGIDASVYMCIKSISVPSTSSVYSHRLFPATSVAHLYPERRSAVPLKKKTGLCNIMIFMWDYKNFVLQTLIEFKHPLLIIILGMANKNNNPSIIGVINGSKWAKNHFYLVLYLFLPFFLRRPSKVPKGQLELTMFLKNYYYIWINLVKWDTFWDCLG